MDIKELERERNVSFGHTFCKANQVVDVLARHDHSLDVEFIAFEHSPEFLSVLLLTDSIGVFFKIKWFELGALGSFIS